MTINRIIVKTFTTNSIYTTWLISLPQKTNVVVQCLQFIT